MGRPKMVTIGRTQGTNPVGIQTRDMYLLSQARTWTNLKVRSTWAPRPGRSPLLEDRCLQVVVEVEAGGG
jgi:hypothetical protein